MGLGHRTGRIHLADHPHAHRHVLRKEMEQVLMLRKPWVFKFLPWVHAQELSQHMEKATWWCRHLTIGRIVIMWNAPTNKESPRTAVLRGEPAKLRIPKEKP